MAVVGCDAATALGRFSGVTAVLLLVLLVSPTRWCVSSGCLLRSPLGSTHTHIPPSLLRSDIDSHHARCASFPLFPLSPFRRWTLRRPSLTPAFPALASAVASAVAFSAASNGVGHCAMSPLSFRGGFPPSSLVPPPTAMLEAGVPPHGFPAMSDKVPPPSDAAAVGVASTFPISWIPCPPTCSPGPCCPNCGGGEGAHPP